MPDDWHKHTDSCVVGRCEDPYQDLTACAGSVGCGTCDIPADP